MEKVLIFMSVVALFVSSFVGCGKKDDGDANVNASPSPSVSAEAAVDADADSFQKYLIDFKNITLECAKKMETATDVQQVVDAAHVYNDKNSKLGKRLNALMEKFPGVNIYGNNIPSDLKPYVEDSSKANQEFSKQMSSASERFENDWRIMEAFQ